MSAITNLIEKKHFIISNKTAIYVTNYDLLVYNGNWTSMIYIMIWKLKIFVVFVAFNLTI